MMVETELENGEKIWKKFLRKHWNIVVLFVVGAILVSIGAIFVYLWVVGDAQLTGLVPATLDLWAMGYIVTFLLHLIFWEAILIGIPVILAAVVCWLWWKKLPDDEKEGYKRGHLFGKRSRRTEGGEGISFLIFIVFIIKIYLDGNWNVAFATWSFDYLVYSFNHIRNSYSYRWYLVVTP